MPRVPQYQPSVGASNLPGARAARVDVSSGLMGLAQGVERAGGIAAQIQQQEAEKADASALLEADRRLSAWEIENLHRPETGALNRKGRDALGVIDELVPQLDNTLGEIEAGLNERQRQRFRQMANGRRRSIEQTLNQHVAGQSDGILQSELQAYQQTALAAISVNAGNDERVQEELTRLQVAQEVAADRLGMPVEARRAMAQATLQQAHSAVMDQLLSRGDYTAARRYFDGHRDLLGAKSAQYQEQVRRGDVIQQSQEIADDLVLSYSGATRTREARKIQDPEVRDAVMRRLDAESAREERERNQFERQQTESAWGKINTGGGIESLSPLEFTTVAKSSGALAAMENRARQIARGEAPETDIEVWYALQSTAVDDPAEFARMDLLQFTDRLSTSDMQSLARLQTGVASSMQSGGAMPSEMEDWRTEQRLLDDTLDQAKISDKDRAAFSRQMADQVYQFRERNNRAPDHREMQQIADDLLLEGRVPGSWFGTNSARRFEALSDGVPFTPSEVPRDEAARIRRALMANGMENPTDRDILEFYQLTYQGDADE